MNTLAKRLDRLESTHGGNGRLIVMRTEVAHTDEDVNRVLEARRVKARSQDTIVCLRTIYEERDGDLPAKGPPVLLSVTP